MVRTNYQRGRDREQYIKGKYQKKGFIVLRMASSKGFADLVAIDKENRQIKFIQVKPKKFSDNQKKKLEDEFGFINDEYLCSFHVE